jgi:hypothetical protein
MCSSTAACHARERETKCGREKEILQRRDKKEQSKRGSEGKLFWRERGGLFWNRPRVKKGTVPLIIKEVPCLQCETEGEIEREKGAGEGGTEREGELLPAVRENERGRK